MLAGRFLFALHLSAVLSSATSVAVLPFENRSDLPDLAWVGESIAETLRTEFAQHDEIVIGREMQREGLRRLALRESVPITKASLIKLGQTLDADLICYGEFSLTTRPGATVRDSSLTIRARTLDLRRFRDDVGFSETGQLVDLSRLEEHLAWQLLSRRQPAARLMADDFTNPGRLIHLDAKESYVRGLLAANFEQKQKWFTQAARLDGRYASPAFALGELLTSRRNYRQAVEWLLKVPPADSHYPRARFQLGLCAYALADFPGAGRYFREVSQLVPLNEVFNNLGAAESRLNLPSAMDDFRRAADGDRSEPLYSFNLGLALLKGGYFADASRQFEQVLDHDPEDRDCRQLSQLAAQHNSAVRPGMERLKTNFDETAYRQLKQLLQNPIKSE